MTPTNYNLTNIGYLIVEEPKRGRGTDEVRYFGVDRLPPFIAPDVGTYGILTREPVLDPRLMNAIAEWFDARSNNSAFLTNESQALHLLRSFRSFGLKLELIYCQLAWGLGEEERVKSYVLPPSVPSAITLTYGFDVSWPTCNHSAIKQPGVVPTNRSWQNKLNEWGLLDQFGDVEQLREEYLKIYPYPPFDIYLVHRIAVSTTGE